jgi:hypothetical protein
MRRLISLLVAVLLLVPVGAFAAGAAPAGKSNLSVVHGVPGAIVDVYVDGALTIDNFTYETVAGPLAVDSGSHMVQVMADGETPAVDTPLLGGTVELPPGGDVTAVAHLDEAGGLALSVFTNDTSLTKSGQGRVVVRHTAKAPAVDVLAAGEVLMATLANGEERQADLPSATYPVTLNAAGTSTQAFPATGAVDLAIPSNTSVIVYAIGDLAGDFTVVTQAIDLGMADGYGILTVVHGVPGLTVDVYLNGTLAIPGFAPDTITDQFLMAAGTYDIAIYAADSDPLATAPAIVAPGVVVPAGANATVVAHLDAGGMPTASVFLDDVSSIDSGNARVTVRHTANAPAVDVLAGGAVLLPNLANGGGAGADVPAGQYGVTLNAAGTTTQAYPASGAVDVDLAEGANTVVYAVGTLGGDFKLLVDVVDGLGEDGAFGDIAKSVHKSNISVIARVGVTKGKTATTFGPNDPVTRGQMAAFIQRALGLPGSSVDAFTDDDGSIFENDINAIAAFGITKGKTATTFGPNDTVTRGQMAAFITRAFNLTGGGSTPFTDISDSVFAADIAALYNAGITKGTTATTFSPNDPVTRGQMASFLARALGIGS